MDHTKHCRNRVTQVKIENFPLKILLLIKAVSQVLCMLLCKEEGSGEESTGGMLRDSTSFPSKIRHVTSHISQLHKQFCAFPSISRELDQLH